MSKLDWLNDIDYDDLLSSDMKLIRDRCGEDVLKALLANIPSIHIYMSEKPLNKARERYIRRYYTGTNAKELAARLGCSERFVFKVSRARAKNEAPTNSQKSLF